MRTTLTAHTAIALFALVLRTAQAAEEPPPLSRAVVSATGAPVAHAVLECSFRLYRVGNGLCFPDDSLRISVFRTIADTYGVCALPDKELDTPSTLQADYRILFEVKVEAPGFASTAFAAHA